MSQDPNNGNPPTDANAQALMNMLLAAMANVNVNNGQQVNIPQPPQLSIRTFCEYPCVNSVTTRQPVGNHSTNYL